MTRKDYELVAKSLHEVRLRMISNPVKYETWVLISQSLMNNFELENDKFSKDKFINAMDNCKDNCINCK